ncbi:hypothetical protein SAMN06265173_12610 [Thalassovita litoralis]|uniref:Uncharacterized protein n=1 Tax=Thalassovita litoralis TaxID=1010611 RepID=A0A521FAV5_9RHOB|nr:hypothetical protein [Thalassovita litoralis]SMO93266.1 hypothetical protein SAMN06265173_12610 [Thalassovita litoralis]
MSETISAYSYLETDEYTGEIDALNAVSWGDEIERWRDTDPEWNEVPVWL